MNWLVLFFFVALLNWASVEFNWRRIELVSKPLALVALVLCFWEILGWQGNPVWFGIALVFSLVGDILLLWPKKLFLPGLAVFLAAQICYIAGFNQDPIPVHWGSLVALVLAAAVGYYCHRLIRKGMQNNQECSNMRLPVLVYTIVVTTMMLSAWLCLVRPEWPMRAGWLAAVGGTLFVISDAMLAFGMFCRPIAHGPLWGMITYLLGQVGILAGVLLRYSG